jgi:alkyl sulfatase BDS1-like metallo-beta-lactamase superfamily hydrolase
LRNGVPDLGGIKPARPDTIKAMPPEELFNYLGVRLNGEKAAGKKLTLNVNFTDLDAPYALTVENGTLNYSTQSAPTAAATVTLTKAMLDIVQFGHVSLGRAIAAGDVTIEVGRRPWASFSGGSTPSRSGSIS